MGSLVAKRQSLVRWGDGDTLSALGVGNSFEPPNPHLATELIRLLRTATSDPNLHLGLPLSFLNPGSRKNIANNRLKAWGLTLLFLEREIQEPVEVLDSFIFRGTKGAPRLSEQISLTSLLTIISPRPVIAVGPPSFINHFAAEKLKLMAGHVEMAETRAFSELGSLTGQVRNRMRDAPGAVVLVSGGSAGRLLIGRLRGEGSLLDVGQIV